MKNTATPAAIPFDEALRIRSLERLELLDTPAEILFDDLVSLARLLFNVPIALVSMIDADRQWFKARIGIAMLELPRDEAFCAHAILTPDEVMCVVDASRDARFEKNALVIGPPYIRFYAGASVLSPEGYPLGTVCIIDTVPRKLAASEYETLKALARQASSLLRLRALSLESDRQMRGLSQKVIEAFSNGNSINRALQKNQRAAFLGSLVSGVARELDGSLRASEETFRVLQTSKLPPASVAVLATEGLQLLSRGAFFISHLLALSSDTPHLIQVVDVTARLKVSLALFQCVIRRDIVVQLTLGGQTAKVNCDEIQLETAVLNMVLNAADAMRGAGVIVISTTVSHIVGDVILLDGDYVLVRVQDNGAGMCEAVERKVFEPFFTTKEEDSAGLGMTQIMGFAMQCGGTAQISSQVGQGTEVRLYLRSIPVQQTVATAS